MLKLFCYTFCLCCLVLKPAGAFIYFLPDYHPTGVSGNGPNTLTLEKSCPQFGYDKTSCPEGSFLFNRCPYSSRYFNKCKLNAEYCSEQGYVSSCPSGQIPDLSQICSKSGSWYKCKCDPCEGYTYTYAQATAEGYVIDGAGCQNCSELKYKRKPAPCSGYNYNDTNCNVSICEKLEGGSCLSGTKVKYKECTPCIIPCPSGKVNIDTYWCDSALRCLLPAES